MGPNAWFGDKQRAEGYNPNLIEVQENAGPVPGIAYRGQDAQRNYGYMGTFRGSISYITGAHRFKAGAQLQQTEAAFISYYNNYRLRYVFTSPDPRSPTPTSLTMYGNHAARNPFEMDTFAAFVQDVWTAGRLTLQGGLRFERITSFYPESTLYPDVFIPQALTFPAQDAGVGPKDINPRFGAAYDVFGTGKTVAEIQPGPVSDAGQLVRRLRIPAAAGQPRRDDDEPELERPDDVPGRRPAERQLHSRLRPVEPGAQRRVRAVEQPELRQGRRLDHLRPEGAGRLECA